MPVPSALDSILAHAATAAAATGIDFARAKPLVRDALRHALVSRVVTLTESESVGPAAAQAQEDLALVAVSLALVGVVSHVDDRCKAKGVPLADFPRGLGEAVFAVLAKHGAGACGKAGGHETSRPA